MSFAHKFLGSISLIVASSVHATPTANLSHQLTGIHTMTSSTNLSQKQVNLVRIGALVAKPDMVMLKTALNQALDQGMTINEIKDEMVQLYAYCGFPRSLNALTALDEVIKQRQQQGKKDVEGKSATPLPADTDILALGTQTQTQLAGKPVNITLSKDIDRYLKTHLFGDIFASDVLNQQERELITVSALASMQGVESQLKSHFGISQNIGISKAQLQAVLANIADISPEQHDKAVETLNSL